MFEIVAHQMVAHETQLLAYSDVIAGLCSCKVEIFTVQFIFTSAEYTFESKRPRSWLEC